MKQTPTAFIYIQPMPFSRAFKIEIEIRTLPTVAEKKRARLEYDISRGWL